jgi:phosphomethylpyrimidine synthase
MTLVELVKKGIINKEIKQVAEREQVSIDFIKAGLINGTIVIPVNKYRKRDSKFKIQGIGKGLRTKVNANIGTSPDYIDLNKELKKLEIAIKTGADTIMDLSTGGNLRKIRTEIIKNSIVPVGTVPIYQVVCEQLSRGKQIKKIDPEYIFEIIEQHCYDGVDFITVHCGVTKKTLNILKKSRRICGIVSRGGSFLAEWVLSNNKENPLYERYDRLLDIAYRYDVTLSLGDGLRPGAIADASDEAQLSELNVLGELVLEARKKCVQVIVEGPGHMPLNQIIQHIKYAKKVTHDAPYYVLGPLVTDIAAGFDHITSAIGGAISAAYGVDFLCYVTPSEHLRLPNMDDVYLGVIASRIAAHSGDIVKGIKGANEWDNKFSLARRKLDWKQQEQLALEQNKFRIERKKMLTDNKACTMCGKYCAMRESNKLLYK